MSKDIRVGLIWADNMTDKYRPPQDLFVIYVEVYREGMSLQKQFQYYEYQPVEALKRMALMKHARDREELLAIWHLDLESEEPGGWVPYKFEIDVTLKPDPKGPA